MSDKKILVGDMSRETAIGILKLMLEAMEVYDSIAPTPQRRNAVQMAISSLETDEAYQLEYEQPEISKGLFEQIKWERDIAIEQLKELGYEFGEKIESTTKNDLGVDWENCKDVDGNSLDDLILEVLQNNFDCGNTYGYKVADEIIGLLSSVTPQEPRKGHWIVQPSNKEQGERDFIWWKCSECGQVIFSETEHDRLEFHAFCGRCGADMREVEDE